MTFERESLGAAASKVRPKRRVPLAQGEKVAAEILREIGPYAAFALVAGSILRRRPEIADIDIVVLPKDIGQFLAFMDRKGFAGGDRHRMKVVKGLQVEMRIAHEPEELGAHIFMYTGDWLWNVSMRSIAKRRGWKLDQYGIWDRSTNQPILQSPYEEDFFGALGVDYHAPEERSLAHREKGSKRKASMGVYVPQDWSPRPFHPVPGADNLFTRLNVDWDAREWREPDAKGHLIFYWYGPGGPEDAEEATVAEWRAWKRGWDVTEYQFIPEERAYMERQVFVSAVVLRDALWALQGMNVPLEEILGNPESWSRYAPGLGTTILALFSEGNPEWAEELPRP